MSARPAHVLLEVLRDGLEFVDEDFCRSAGSICDSVEAMIDVIVNQSPLGLPDGLFDGMQLLRQIEAGASFAEHFDHPAEMTVGPLQPLDDIGMSFVKMLLCHD